MYRKQYRNMGMHILKWRLSTRFGLVDKSTLYIVPKSIGLDSIIDKILKNMLEMAAHANANDTIQY